MYKYTLENGSVIAANTQSELNDLLDKLGIEVDFTKYYFSKTKGLVLISEMNDYHLKNAVFKLYYEWVNNQIHLPPSQTILALVEGPDFNNDDNQLYGLMQEAIKRFII